MRRARRDQELVIRSLLERLGESAGDPTEAYLCTAARLAAAEGRAPQERSGTKPWRPLRLRWALAGAAAVLLATGLGFGIGSWLTPAGSARSDLVGLGFLPARGWAVMQSGRAAGAESALAAAANVSFRPADRPGRPPRATLRALPPDGIVIVATLTTRGHPTLDLAFAPGPTRLRLADALSLPATARWPYRHGLRTAIGGYNVDLKVTFGRRPTASMLREADEQIERLVVAPAAVTIAVRPTVYGEDPLIVYGSVSNGKAGEKVTVQFRQCGLYPVQFRDVVELTTETGGGWSTELGIAANGTLRAVAGGDVSNEVPVKARPDVRLSPTPSGKYVTHVVAQISFWHKKVLIQRHDRRLGRWVKLKTLPLTTSNAAPGSQFVWSSSEKFVPKAPKGTTIRAVLPLDQARPCFIAGYSNTVRT